LRPSDGAGSSGLGERAMLFVRPLRTGMPDGDETDGDAEADADADADTDADGDDRPRRWGASGACVDTDMPARGNGTGAEWL
jgi:hypothetical protein